MSNELIGKGGNKDGNPYTGLVSVGKMIPIVHIDTGTVVWEDYHNPELGTQPLSNSWSHYIPRPSENPVVAERVDLSSNRPSRRIKERARTRLERPYRFAIMQLTQYRINNDLRRAQESGSEIQSDPFATQRKVFNSVVYRYYRRFVKPSQK